MMFISYYCAVVLPVCAQPITCYGLISLQIIHVQLTGNHRATYLIQQGKCTKGHVDMMRSSTGEFSITYSMIQLKLTFESLFESNRHFIGLTIALFYGLG